MEAFLAGLNNLMDPHVLIAIALGSIGGLMIGAVPGIGPAIAIAILLGVDVWRSDPCNFDQYAGNAGECADHL